MFCQKYLSSLETANKVSLERGKKTRSLFLLNLKREDTYTRTLKATQEKAGYILKTFNCFLLFQTASGRMKTSELLRDSWPT